MTKYRVYYWLSKECMAEVEAENEADAIKQIKEDPFDGDELSEMLDEEGSIECEEVFP